VSNKAAARIDGIRTVGIAVTDQDRALEFYVDTLGFEKRLDVPTQAGRRWIEVAPPASATTIALIAAHDGLPVGVETGIRLTADDAAGVHAYFLESSVDSDELLLWEGVPPMFAFRDQDGNGLEIVGGHTPSRLAQDEGITRSPG
jgi:lactoylglutathione lyase